MSIHVCLADLVIQYGMRKFESFFQFFFLTFPCVNAKLATVHCEKHVPLANFAYTLIFPKLLGRLLIYILRSL